MGAVGYGIVIVFYCHILLHDVLQFLRLVC